MPPRLVEYSCKLSFKAPSPAQISLSLQMGKNSMPRFVSDDEDSKDTFLTECELLHYSQKCSG